MQSGAEFGGQTIAAHCVCLSLEKSPPFPMHFDGVGISISRTALITISPRLAAFITL
jgi:hypothetical protein